ncbi:unnamed protein product [Haemonchus placei]|uniref:Uncharacterized protein n=1 Tax=Haemonchus placei TaxID=6290 RepID=A0A0N4WLA6_HAEPC|nr:unnamed protein product [Haemonchus placei]
MATYRRRTDRWTTDDGDAIAGDDDSDDDDDAHGGGDGDDVADVVCPHLVISPRRSPFIPPTLPTDNITAVHYVIC